MAHEFVFTMQDVSRVVGEGRVILEGITLAFFPGAKIGVLGHNGAGKSSLLRIMAGLDDEFTGEAKPAAGVRVGYLPQEPELDPDKDVMGNVEEGVGEVRDLLRRFEEVSNRFAEPLEDDEMNELLEEQGKLQDAIDAANGWEQLVDANVTAVESGSSHTTFTKTDGSLWTIGYSTFGQLGYGAHARLDSNPERVPSHTTPIPWSISDLATLSAG